MVFRSKLALAAGIFGAAATIAVPAAHAGCKKMGFTVNDYGKDGPTADAKSLLDKHIATWATEQGIEKYTVGKKDVKCELFLNFIVFDEHTCTASATVCWGNDKAKDEQAAGKKSKAPAETAKADAEPKASAVKTDPAPEPGIEATAASETDPAAADATPPAAEPAPPAAAAAATTTPAAPVETGAIPPKAPADGAGSDAAKAAAEAAAQAAERAAAAAERAAAAAERAAAALAKSPPAGGDAPPAYASPATPLTAPEGGAAKN